MNESVTQSSEEDDRGGIILGHQGISGFAIQQQLCSKSHLGLVAA